MSSPHMLLLAKKKVYYKSLIINCTHKLNFILEVSWTLVLPNGSRNLKNGELRFGVRNGDWLKAARWSGKCRHKWRATLRWHHTFFGRLSVTVLQWEFCNTLDSSCFTHLLAAQFRSCMCICHDLRKVDKMSGKYENRVQVVCVSLYIDTHTHIHTYINFNLEFPIYVF